MKFALLFRTLMIKMGLKKKRNVELIGYEKIFEFLESRSVLAIPGDCVEIGALIGEGSRKFSQFLSKKASEKRLIVIDSFDPTMDPTRVTPDPSAIDVTTLYTNIIRDHGPGTQWEIFQRITRECTNIVVIKEDSKNVTFTSQTFCFGLVDGNHTDEYVHNDFRLIWDNLSSGGYLAFHDYGGGQPSITDAIDAVLERYKDQIQDTFVIPENALIFLKKV